MLVAGCWVLDARCWMSRFPTLVGIGIFPTPDSRLPTLVGVGISAGASTSAAQLRWSCVYLSLMWTESICILVLPPRRRGAKKGRDRENHRGFCVISTDISSAQQSSAHRRTLRLQIYICERKLRQWGSAESISTLHIH